ncbi:MAG: hypothetical protein JWM10_1436 [Myxococcaceae bacterium]|nr:hypothetical protein [Myxococcaceae bacterium]
MRLSFLAELAVLPHDDREAAVDLAAAGYVAEHLEAGGSFASR